MQPGIVVVNCDTEHVGKNFRRQVTKTGVGRIKRRTDRPVRVNERRWRRLLRNLLPKESRRRIGKKKRIKWKILYNW